MKRESFRASRGMVENEIQTRIKSNNLLKRQNCFAREGGGDWIQTRNKSRERYNGSSSFSNNWMKCQSFRASRGRGETEK